MSRYVETGALSYQQHTDWRCSTTAWRRGRWRPVVSVRFGVASRPWFGLTFGRDEENQWSLTIGGVFFDVYATLTGPWSALHHYGEDKP